MELDKEEQELLDSLERGEWKRVENFEQVKAEFEAMAAAHVAKRGMIQISLSDTDLAYYRQKARDAGLSFEEYISRLLHDLATAH